MHRFYSLMFVVAVVVGGGTAFFPHPVDAAILQYETVGPNDPQPTCSWQEHEAIAAAFRAAEYPVGLADAAVYRLSRSNGSYEDDQLYRRWFISYTYVDAVSRVFNRELALFRSTTDRVVVTCLPAPQGRNPWAAVSAQHVLKIYPRFFQESLETGIDSRRQIIIHEMAHYVDDNVVDHTYSCSEVLGPYRNSNNAATYEYFVYELLGGRCNV